MTESYEILFYIKIFNDYSCTLYKNGIDFTDGLNFQFCFTQIILN